jgi:hypothetical protein
MGLAMQKKFTRSIVLLIMCFLAISIFFACVEEPFIEPSVIPYSVLRVGNLTSNLDEIAVVIDGEYPVSDMQALQKNEFTDHFELVAGRRYFAVLNPTNGDTVYRKWIEVQSFEEQTFWYSGFWNQSIDTSSADFFLHSDAFTYLEKDPAPNHLNLYFLHAAGTNPDTAAVKLGPSLKTYCLVKLVVKAFWKMTTDLLFEEPKMMSSWQNLAELFQQECGHGCI